MKKCLVSCIFIMFSLLLLPVALADDVDMPATGDLWDNWDASQDFYGQDKSVTDEEFDETIQKLKDKKNKWSNWVKKRQIPKGEEFSQSNETEIINTQSEKESLPVISLPVELSVGEDVLPVGHYQVKCEKTDGNVVLKLYQAQYVMAQFPARETTDDFGEETISFTRWFPENDNQIKIIYGSMDFNAYAVIDIAQ